MNSKAVHESEFYHEGRGPELQETIWGNRGATLLGFTYYNPDDVYDLEHLKHLKLEKVEAFMMSSDEVHPNILLNGVSKGAIFEVLDSQWLSQFDSPHVEDCKHYQIAFYDEIYDVICKAVTPGKGPLAA